MGEMAAVTLLRTEKLDRKFGGLHAVKAVDLEVPEGEIRALIGPNGAGKTTLVSMMCGRIPASSGRICFAGRDVTGLAAHKRIQMGMAYTFQITSIFSTLTVRENLVLAVQRDPKIGRDLCDARVREALERVGLEDRASQVAGDLSYGHQRLLEVAMGIGQSPRLLILDEPTQGLTDGEVEAFISLIREVAETTTILLIEHNISVVMALADRITVMNFGEIIAEGTPAEIRQNHAVQEAYLGG